MERPFGDYVLVARIGAGGMGEVFRARKTGPEGFSKEVAVKLILPHLSQEEPFRSLFSREARMAAGLKHPNIVDVHGFVHVGQTAVIEMELVDGADLRRLLRALPPGERLPAAEASLILHRVARGLAHAHAPRGETPPLVHRDLSPQNILLSREGEVKVADFGIARAAEEGTTAGGPKGKAMYMSPEQARGEDLTPASDLFTLGIIAHQVLTGRHPFDRGSEAAALAAISSGRHDPIPSDAGLPPALAALAADLLRLDPRERPSAEQVVRVLDPFVSAEAERELGERVRSLTGRGVPAESAEATAATIRPRRSPWPLAAGAAAASALVLLAFLVPEKRPTATLPDRRGTEPPAPRESPVKPPSLPVAVERADETPVLPDRSLTVTIVTNPPGAQILDGGSPLGRSPLQVRTDPSTGERRLMARLDGFKDREFVLGGPSEDNVADIALWPLPTGSVKINANPWADVFYRDVHIGLTPCEVDGLPVGKRTLVLKNAALGLRREVVVDVTEGSTTLNVDLKSPQP